MEPRLDHARAAHAVLRRALHAACDFGDDEARDEVAARFAREPDGAVLLGGGNKVMVAHASLQ